MAIYGNFKGTTQSGFQIGKSGSVIHSDNNQPASASQGDVWMDSSNTALKIYNGSDWNDLLSDPLPHGNILLGNSSNKSVTANLDVSVGSLGFVKSNPGIGGFVYNQSVAASVWSVSHNLGQQYLNIEIIDDTGNSITGTYGYPTINFVNANQLTATFSTPTAGYLVASSGQGYAGSTGFTGSQGFTNFTLAGDTGSDVVNSGETLTMVGATNQIETTVSNNQLSVAIVDGANIANLTVTGSLSSENISTTGNVDAGNINLTDSLKVGTDSTGNISGVDVLTAANVDAGNVNVTDAILVNGGSGGSITGVVDLTASGNVDAGNINVTNSIILAGATATAKFGDDAKANFGSGDDLQVYHDGTNSYIDDTGTGSLFLRSGTIYFQNLAGTKTSIQTNSGGAQTFYHNNSAKLETSANGITVTGNVDAGNVNATGDVSAVNGEFSGLVTFGSGSGGSITGLETFSANALTASANLTVNGFMVDGIIDDDTMGTASNTTISTSESVKAYVDSQSTSSDLDIAGNSGTGTVALDSQSLTIDGGTGLTSAASGQTITVNLDATGVTAKTYGSTTEIPVLTVNAQGQLTAVSNATISTSWTLSGDSGSETVSGGDTATFAGDTNITTAASATDTLTISLNNDITIDSANVSGNIDAGNINLTNSLKVGTDVAGNISGVDVLTAANVDSGNVNVTDTITVSSGTGGTITTGNVDAGNVNVTDAILVNGGSGGTITGVVDLTASGNVDAGNINVTDGILVGYYLETYQALSGTTVAIDCTAASTFSLTTSGSTTFSFTNVPSTANTALGFTLEVYAGGTHSLTWPASVKWAGGSEPDDPASGETNIYGFYTRDAGTTWYGFLSGAAMA